MLRSTESEWAEYLNFSFVCYRRMRFGANRISLERDDRWYRLVSGFDRRGWCWIKEVKWRRVIFEVQLEDWRREQFFQLRGVCKVDTQRPQRQKIDSQRGKAKVMPRWGWSCWQKSKGWGSHESWFDVCCWRKRKRDNCTPGLAPKASNLGSGRTGLDEVN